MKNTKTIISLQILIFSAFIISAQNADSVLNGPIQRLDINNVFYRIDRYDEGRLDSIVFYSYVCEKRKIYQIDELSETPRLVENISFSEYIERNLKQPTTPDFVDYIFISAIIESDGSINNIYVVKDILYCDQCRQDAINVIKSMSSLIPGKVSGTFVPCFFTFIIKFGC